MGKVISTKFISIILFRNTMNW